MKKILRFEYLKFIKTKKNWILSLFILLFTLLNVYSSNKISDDTMVDLKNNLSEQISILDSENKRAESDIESDNIDKETKESIEKYMVNTQETIARYQKQVDSIENNNFEQYWIIEKKNINSIVNNSKIDESNKFNLQKQYKQLDYIATNNIPFEKNEMMPNKSWSFMPDFLALQSSFIIIIALILILGDIVSKDFESNNRFLYTTLFRKKRNIIISKLIIAVGLFTLLFLMQAVTIFVIQGIINGFGSAIYPVLLGNNLETLSISPVIYFFLKYFIYYIVLILFLTSVGCLLGLLIRKNTLVIGSMSIVYLAFFYLKDNPIVQKISGFNPITYMDVYSVTCYSEKSLSSNSYLIGMLYLTILSIIFIILNFRLTKDQY